jgi:hypothetical protein
MKSEPLMESELFVINSVTSSEHARSAVAELIPGRDAHDLLRVLQNPDKFRQAAANMGVSYEEVFEHLKKAIVNVFNRRAPVRLTREHVRKLQNADVQHALAKVLGCAPDAALQTLFSVSALQETLNYLTSGQSVTFQAHAAQLLGEILKPIRAQQLEFDCNTTENDWETIFDGEEWLSPAIKKLLVDSVVVPGRTTPCSALAELIKRAKEDDSDPSKIDLDRSTTLDSLGLRALRRRLAWILESLRKETLEGAEKVAVTMPGSPSVQLSLPVLQIYEFGNIAQGLRDYINHAHTLKTLLPEKTIAVYDVEMEKVVADSPLVFSGKPLYEVEGNQVGNFEIQCILRDQSNPQVILSATDVKSWVYHQLSHDIPKLTPDELSIVGDQLHEQLLSTSFPMLDPQTRLLKEAVNTLGVEFVRAAALSCETLIEDIPELFRSKVATRLPYQELPGKTDPLYPHGVEEIIASHKKTYKDSLRIERGSRISDSSQSESS